MNNFYTPPREPLLENDLPVVESTIKIESLGERIPEIAPYLDPKVVRCTRDLSSISRWVVFLQSKFGGYHDYTHQDKSTYLLEALFSEEVVNQDDTLGWLSDLQKYNEQNPEFEINEKELLPLLFYGIVSHDFGNLTELNPEFEKLINVSIERDEFIKNSDKLSESGKRAILALKSHTAEMSEERSVKIAKYTYRESYYRNWEGNEDPKIMEKRLQAHLKFIEYIILKTRFGKEYDSNLEEPFNNVKVVDRLSMYTGINYNEMLTTIVHLAREKISENSEEELRLIDVLNYPSDEAKRLLGETGFTNLKRLIFNLDHSKAFYNKFTLPKYVDIDKIEDEEFKSILLTKYNWSDIIKILATNDNLKKVLNLENQ